MKLYLWDESSLSVHTIESKGSVLWQDLPGNPLSNKTLSPVGRAAVLPLRYLFVENQSQEGRLTQTEFLQELLRLSQELPDCRVILPLSQSGEILLLLLGSPSYTLSVCQELRTRIANSTGFHLPIGVGPSCRDYQQFSRSLEAARTNAVSWNLLHPEDGIYTQTPDESHLRPYNLTAWEDRLYAEILTGSSPSIRRAVERLTGELFASDFFCLRQLSRLEILYHGMRINWMERLRIRYPQKEGDLTPPAFYFSYGFNRRGDFSPELFTEGLCADLSAAAAFCSRLSHDQAAGQRFLEQVRQYIDLNCHLPLSQQEIADRFFISANYLSHAFKRYMGIGMIQYMNQIRIRRAKELLSGTPLSIRQIATQTGFRDEKYFSRVFRRMTGLSPSQYRKSCRTEGSSS